MRRCLWVIGMTGSLLAGGCAGQQSALDPAGAQAGQIDGLWWLFFWTTTAVYGLVLWFLAWSCLRARRFQKDLSEEGKMEGEPVVEPDAGTTRRMTRVVTVALAVTVAVLFVFLLSDLFTGRKLHALADDPDPLVIRVIGHQWWWEFEYQDPMPSKQMRTANELHLPVGRTVRLELDSSDVIHSFWIPNLHGKNDLIPGHPATTWLRADRPGSFRGQCAEFCGLQHAHMRFTVETESAAAFEAWLERQRQAAPEPATASQRRGRDVFLASSCVMCHTIQGTAAQATIGPALTHLAGRSTLGAGTLPNTRGYRAGWIVDPQKLKPGVRMPPNNLPAADLQALLDYLDTLK